MTGSLSGTGRAIALATGFGFVMAGCALTPDYERPELDLPAGWTEPAVAGESIANLPWWDLYQDEALRELIELALDQNQDLAIALARIDESRHQLTVVRADQFPFLGVFGEASQSRMSRVISPAAKTVETYSVGGNLSFELDLWRKFSRATEAARNELLSSEAAHRAVTISLVAGVARTYFLLRDLDQRLAIADRTTTGRTESLRIIQERFNKGTVPELDVNQAQIELAIAQAAAADFQRRVAQVQNALSVLVGRYPGAIERGLALDEQSAPPEIPAGLPSELLRRRPDIVSAEETLAAETARIGVAEAFRYPAISLTGSIGLITDELTDFNANEAKAFNIAADLFQPIFNSGQLKAQANVQRARAEQALHAYVGTVQVALREVEDGLVAVRTLQLIYEARARQVVAARNAARLSRARYDGGIVDYLELLDAERTLFSSELDASESRQAVLNAVVDLYAALGGGWNPKLELDPEPDAEPNAEAEPQP